MIHLYQYTGGNLAKYSNIGGGQVRGVVPITFEGPILWNDENDLSLSVIKDGERLFIKNTSENLDQYDEVEGIYVSLGDQKFIIKLHDEQSGAITVSSAMSLYGDILPNYTQAEIISMKYSQINTALSRFGGSKFSLGQYDYYMTCSPCNTDYNYQIYLYKYTGGNLADYTNQKYGYIRGVIEIK